MPIAPETNARSWVVIDTATLTPHSEALQFVLYLRARAGRRTRCAYTRAVATNLTWCETTGNDWSTASLDELARFKIALESTSTPNGGVRSGRTVDLALTALCEFLRRPLATRIQRWRGG